MLGQRIIGGIVSLLLISQPTLSNATTTTISPQHAISKTAALLTDVHQQLDRTAFDFDAVLDLLDYEAQDIIAFSKSAIAFEQYPGVLRGPRGVLFSRAGNAIDQATLLAKLLRDAGYDARIAGAELTVEQARMVLRAMGQPVTPPPPLGDTDGLIRVLQKHGLVEPIITDVARQAYADYLHNAPPAKRYAVHDQVNEVGDFVRGILRQGGVDFDPAQLDQKLIAEARDYYWVQYQSEVAGGWIDVHPVFRSNVPFATPDPDTYFSDDIPPRLQHRLRMQVFIERKTGDKLAAIPVTSAWERPIANLIGVPLTFANSADSMSQSGTGALSLEQTLAKASSFVPTLGAGLAPGAQFFDIRGNVVDPMAAANPAAGIFAEINRAFGDALGELTSKEKIPTLTAQWMDITLIAPDGSEQQFRRTTFDRIGPAARASNDIPADLAPTTLADVRPLLQRHTFGASTGRMPRGYVIESMVTSFEQWAPGLKAFMSGKKAPAKPVSPDWGGVWALYSILDQADTLGDTHRSYRSGPGLLIYSDGLGNKKRYIERVDIVANPRRVFDVSGPDPRFDPGQMVDAGVWETLVESAFLTGDAAYSTTTAFDTAEKLGARPLLLKSETEVEKIATTDDVRASISADLARGYAVIAPSKGTDLSNAGWWRVDPLTGETLGQAFDGRGAAATEEIISGIISFGFLAWGVSGCYGAQVERNQNRTSGNPYVLWDGQGLCCVAANVGLSALTYMIGLFALTTHQFSTIGARAAAVGASGAMDAGTAQIPVDEACGAVFGN